MASTPLQIYGYSTICEQKAYGEKLNIRASFHDIVILREIHTGGFMEEDNKKKSNVKGQLFTIEVLMEAETNGIALEQLLHILNSVAIKDYKVKSGIELGKLIDLNIKESVKQALPHWKDAETKKEAETKTKKQANPAALQETASNTLIAQLESFIQNNVLIRLTVLKGKGVMLNIPCRVLNYDADKQNVSVYHVDEKKVYLFKLNEIDDFVTG
jgi:hypothetical protein